MNPSEPWSYDKLRNLADNETAPFMLVDQQALKRNVERLGSIASNADKSLRVASKSVRVPYLLDRIRTWLGETYGGLMTFSPAETVFLYNQGFDDFLLAYPRIHEEELRSLFELNQAGADLTVMVDEPAHLEAIRSIYDQKDNRYDPLPVCLDRDVSYRPLNVIHLGVQRSPVRTLQDFKTLYRTVRENSSVRFDGVMGYEAQQAGVPDASPYQPIKQYVVRLMKFFSRRWVASSRRAIDDFLETEHEGPYRFNAGGTGSIRSSVREDWVTEVTAGSGFLQSHLFDYYLSNENEPAFCFGLPVTRTPENGIVTCQSGGFIASGPPGDDKSPRPFRPEGIRTLSAEGYGEVQTPLRVPDDYDLEPGDRVFFRPAKAGEIAERFDEYRIVDDYNVINRVRTYRGYGHCFY